MAPRLLDQAHALRDVRLPGDAVLDEGLRGAVEGEADVQGRAASSVQVLHLVPAVARPYADVGGGADHFASPFVVHHLQGRSGTHGTLVHEDPPDARLGAAEEVLHEILLHVQVLVEQFRQQLLVVPVAHAHHGEFEESGHGRREHEEPLLPHLHVQQHSPGSEVLQSRPGLALRLLPVPRRGGHCKWPYGKQGHQGRLLLREEHLEDPEQQFRGRSALGKQVQPVGEALVALPEGDVGHGRHALRNHTGLPAWPCHLPAARECTTLRRTPTPRRGSHQAPRIDSDRRPPATSRLRIPSRLRSPHR